MSSRSFIFTQVATLAKECAGFDSRSDAFEHHLHTTKDVANRIAMLCSGFAHVRLSTVPPETVQELDFGRARDWTLEVQPKF